MLQGLPLTYNYMIKSGFRTSRSKNLYLGDGEDSGILFLYANTSLPDLGSGDRGFGFQSTTPKYWNGSGWTSIGSGGGSTDWDTLYAGDKTLTIDSTTLTFAGTHATGDVFTITNATGTGDCIQITNTGSGSDLKGTSNTWSISKTGAAVFASGQIDAITSSTSLTLDATGAGTITLAGTSTGAITLTRAVTATASIAITGSAGSNVFTITAGDVVFTEGSITVTDDDNAATVDITNDGATTAAGIFKVTADKVTTGTLVRLSLDESALSGGYFLECYQTDAGATKFSIGENGVTVIAGTAASNSFTLTAGDAVMSDGSLTITDADDATSFSLTNNSNIGAGPLFTVASSGTNVGTTTNAFFYLNPAGLTTGTAFYMPLAAMTAGEGMQLIANALTTGRIVDITSTATAITGNGRMFRSYHAGATGGSATLNEFLSDAGDETAVLQVKASGALALGKILNVSGALVTTGSAIVANDLNALTTGIGLDVQSTATAITGAGRLFYSFHNGATGTDAILNEFRTAATDETVLLKLTASGALAAGKILNISGASVTTGYGISLADLNALTDGFGINMASSSTVLSSTGRMLLINHSGNATVSGVIAEVKSAGADETVVFQAKASAGITGAVVNVSAAAMVSGVGIGMTDLAALTTGQAISVAHAASAIANNGSLLKLNSSGINTATTSGCMVNIIGSGSTSGTQVLQTYAALTDGIAESIVASALTSGTLMKLSAVEATLTTGKYIECWDGAADDFSVAKYGATVIAGNAAGTAALTVTLGDLNLAGGKFITETDTDTAVALAATQNTITGKVTTSTANLAATTSETLTITNSRCAATSRIYALISGKGTGGEMIVVNAVPGAGSFTVDCRNISSSAMTSAYQMTYFIINS